MIPKYLDYKVGLVRYRNSYVQKYPWRNTNYFINNQKNTKEK